MSLTRLTFLFLLFNVMTFGNGPVMIPLLHGELVVKAHVLTEGQLLYAFTIARVTPGQANLYVAAIGYMIFGMSGATLSMLAIMLPGYLMLPVLAGFEYLRSSPRIKGFTKGLTVTSVGLIFAATFDIGRNTIQSPIAILIFVLTIVLSMLLKWNPILCLLTGCGAGLALHYLL